MLATAQIYVLCMYKCMSVNTCVSAFVSERNEEIGAINIMQSEFIMSRKPKKCFLDECQTILEENKLNPKEFDKIFVLMLLCYKMAVTVVNCK